MYTYTYIFVHTPRQFDNDKEVSDISYGCIPHTKILLYTMHAWWYRGIKIVSNIRNPFNAIAYNGWALNYCSECILDEFQQNEVYTQVGFAESNNTADNRANIGGTIIGAPIVGQ